MRSSHPGRDVYLIFDVGKTHKKVLLFNRQFSVVFEEQQSFPTTLDDEGFECDDVQLIASWIKEKLAMVSADPSWNIVGINFTAYGASLVHLGEDGAPVCALYNYLKPMRQDMEEQFYLRFGGRENFSLQTSSPALGMLNAGYQLYWLKYYKPEIFRKVRTSLFLPQYLCFLLTGRKFTDLTSIGCHTGLWDFMQGDLHSWVYDEWMQNVLAPITREPVAGYIELKGKTVPVGAGLHDSSSALLPYLYMSDDPFVLVSTGTWAITLNPFNRSPLTAEELKNDVLVYMLPNGDPVKASRMLMGMEHNNQTQRIAEVFGLPPRFYETMTWEEPAYLDTLLRTDGFVRSSEGEWDLSAYGNGHDAYYALLRGLVELLARSVALVDMPEVRTMFVDGGFARNSIFLQMLKRKFPGKRIMTSSVPEATAFGALIYLAQPQRLDLPNSTVVV